MFVIKYIPLTVAVTLASSQAFAKNYLTVEQAQKLMFPGAKTYLASHIRLDNSQKKKIESLSGMRVRNDEQKVWLVKNKTDEAIGLFLLDEVFGKHEFITYAVGLDMRGRVTQVEILDYRETYGGEVRREEWRKQFVGKQVRDPLKLDLDIKNISGATLSCRHVTDGIKRLLAFHAIFYSNG